MRRREFITALGSAAVWPFASPTQQTKNYRLGFLWDSPAVFPEAMEAFQQELRALGYTEGRNINIDYRWAEGNPELMRDMAEELVRLKVDVIVAPSSVYTGAAQRARSAIPIIFFSHADPLGSGQVSSLARPGGNVTGISLMMTETNVKLLELLNEAIPGRSRIAVVWDPATPSHRPGLRALEEAARDLGLQLQTLPVSGPTDYDSAFAATTSGGAEAVLFYRRQYTPRVPNDSRTLRSLIDCHRCSGPASAGGLMSFGPGRADLWRRLLGLFDKTSWPPVAAGASPRAGTQGVRINVGARNARDVAMKGNA